MSTKQPVRTQPARHSKSAAGEKIRLELQKTEEEYKSSESDSDFHSGAEECDPMDVGSDGSDESDDSGESDDQ